MKSSRLQSCMGSCWEVCASNSATQSSCRVQFSELVPVGHEAEFFGLYEVTDKGSAWIGPLVIGAIRNGTGNLKNGFYFLIVFLLIPAFFFYWMNETSGKRDAVICSDCSSSLVRMSL